jgi:hypothetical protein
MHGWSVVIRDAETGEEISSIYRIEITLDARELNIARIYYYKEREDGSHYIDEKTGDAARAECMRNYPEVDVYAYETEISGKCPHCGEEITVQQQ